MACNSSSDYSNFYNRFKSKTTIKKNLIDRKIDQKKVMIDLLLIDFIRFHGINSPIGLHMYGQISRFGLHSSDLQICPYMYGENLPKKN